MTEINNVDAKIWNKSGIYLFIKCFKHSSVAVRKSKVDSGFTPENKDEKK